MRALVTGANGFLGSHLVDLLLEHGGVEIRALVRKTSDLRWLDGKPVELVYGDVTQTPGDLEAALNGVDRVFHLAGLTKALDKGAFFEVNAGGTGNLIRACLARQTPPERFVLVSSADASGPPPGAQALTEEQPARPVTTYGRSKLAAERLAAGYMTELSIAILRPGAIYGPRDIEFFPLFRSMRMGITARFGIRMRRMSLAHGLDAAQAIRLAGEAVGAGSEIFLVGGVNTDQSELARAISLAVGVEKPLKLVVPGPMIRLASLASSGVAKLTRKPTIFSWDNADRLLALNWTIDLTKSERILGYVPEFDIVEGMADTARWYREHGLL